MDLRPADVSAVSDGDVRGFVHVCCMGGYREVAWEIVHALLESRLYDRSVSIDLAVLGTEDDQRFVENLIAPFERFRITYRSTDVAEYEFPALALVQDACQTWDGPVYYLHTKGVSYSPYNQYAHYWRRLMLDEVVENHERCLAALRSCDTAGTNWSDAGLYSGNFWWANAAHIRRLPDIRELRATPRDVTKGVQVDGDSTDRRGAGPLWNQRLQCEYWLQMVPTRAARLGHSRANLYRELCWTTSVADLVNELLAAAHGRRYAELRVGGRSPHFAAVRARRKVSVALGTAEGGKAADFSSEFFSSDPPDGGNDVILLEIRHDPDHLANLIERCLPKLSPDGVIVVCHTNPPSAWHQREAPRQGAEWTGQVWRAVVDFRIRHPDCEVFTVDTDWGCTLIRPSRAARHRLDVESVNDLTWRTLAERRRDLLNVVDVAWFRRHLYATPYLTGAVKPNTPVEFANVLVSVEGLDSYLRIGDGRDAINQIIAPIRHRFADGAGLERYDIVDVDDPGDLEDALDMVADHGWVLVRRPPPIEFESRHPEFDSWTCELGPTRLRVLRRRSESVRSRDGNSLLSSFLREERPQSRGLAARLVTEPYEGNLEVLHSAVELDPEDIRSALFLGDAYFRRGNSEGARTWYTRAADLRDWWWKEFDTAIYVAMLRVARLMEEAGESAHAVRDAFLRAWEICPDRVTPLYAVALRHRLAQRYLLGYLYAKPVADIPLPDPEPPRLVGEVSGWSARDELAHCAFMIGKHDEAYALWQDLLSRNDIPEEERLRIATNRDECVPHLLESASAYPEQIVRSLAVTRGDPGVVVTMVAGPARVSFEQTLNSFLNTCRDVSRVGRFLVVGAGLTPDDRAHLQRRYGFLEFASDGPEHLSSLRPQLDARLWLHVGRGWRFFAPGDFITALADALAEDPQAFRAAMHTGGAVRDDTPALYDTARLDRAGGFGSVDTPDPDALPALARRAAAVGLRSVTVGEISCRAQTLITVIGRGNSGTRAISQTLMRSNVFMGRPIKQDSADLVPAEDMYEACRIISRYIPWRGGLEWDFGPVQAMPIPAEFTQLIERYLSSVLSSSAPLAGWKLPETTLCYPWIRRMFPDIRYIFWVRNPRDCITKAHFTDDLRDFGIDYPQTDDPYLRRAISWKYQDDIVAATPRPRHWIAVRLEDFITRQDRELARLEEFLGIPLTPIPVRGDPIDRHKRVPGLTFPDFLAPAMQKYGYALPGDV